MPKPKTRVSQKRNGSQFSLWSPLKVAADDQGELLREGTGSPTPEEQHLALELLGILRSAIARSSIALSPGEGLEIVRLEMDAWSTEGLEELRVELVSCLERLAKTNKRRSGEAETTSYAHVKSLEMRFHPRATPAPAGAASEPHPKSSLTKEETLRKHDFVNPGEAETKERRPGRASLTEETLPQDAKSMPDLEQATIERPPLLDDLACRMEFYQQRRDERQTASLEDAKNLLRECAGKTMGSHESNKRLTNLLTDLVRKGDGVLLFSGEVETRKGGKGAIQSRRQYQNKKVLLLCDDPKSDSFKITSKYKEYIKVFKLFPDLNVVHESEVPPSEVYELPIEDSAASI